MKKNHYQTLEINESATSEEIKRSYRKLALKYHPDRNPQGDLQTESRFKEIVEAYHILSKPDSKAEYDHYLVRKKNGHQRSHHHDSHSNTATATAKKTEVVTAASLMRQFTTIRRQINDVEDRTRIRQDALYRQLVDLLTINNINLLKSADQQCVRQVIENILQVTKVLNHTYVENLTPRMIKLAGSDNEIISRIYRHNKKHLRKSNCEKRKPFIVIGFVVAAIIAYLIIAFVFARK